MHLDKVYTALQGRESQEETLEESIKITHDLKIILLKMSKTGLCLQLRNAQRMEQQK